MFTPLSKSTLLSMMLIKVTMNNTTRVVVDEELPVLKCLLVLQVTNVNAYH